MRQPRSAQKRCRVRMMSWKYMAGGDYPFFRPLHATTQDFLDLLGALEDGAGADLEGAVAGALEARAAAVFAPREAGALDTGAASFFELAGALLDLGSPFFDLGAPRVLLGFGAASDARTADRSACSRPSRVARSASANSGPSTSCFKYAYADCQRCAAMRVPQSAMPLGS